jgi:hypothetical protein
MIGFATETYAAVVEDIQPLLARHDAEVESICFVLAPDWRMYEALEAAGALAIFTARDGATLVGYAVFFVVKHPHHEGMRLAQNDILFLEKPYRRGRNALRFVEFCELQLQCRADRIAWSAKQGRDWSRLLLHRGYRPDEVIYVRDTQWDQA